MRHLACLLVLIAAPAFAQEESWVGKTVITKHFGIGINRIDNLGKEDYVGKLTDSIHYRVLADKGNKIKVAKSDGVEGWFDKTDAVLPEQAVEHFSAVIKNAPRDAGAYQKRAFARAAAGNLDGALRDVNETIHLAFYDVAAWNSRGILYCAKKDYDRAILDLNYVIIMQPGFVAAYCNRGYAYTGKKQYGKAITDFSTAIGLEPNMVFAYSNRGLAWFLKKDYERAINDFDKAQKLDPNDASVYKNRAWMLATCADAKFRDGKKAVELAKKALELASNPDGDFHHVLAAAHAEAGNFAEAVSVLEKMQADLRWVGDDLARQRLELFRQKKVYRQE